VSEARKVLVIGSGPIVIGQACEFDYSGTQAIKSLREAGCAVVLVNSNPATIMTDPGLADRTYVEPLTPEYLELVIERERPDALLPTIGGQTALNLAVALADRGVLRRFSVEMLGASAEVIRRAEDRGLFKRAMEAAGLSAPLGRAVRGFKEAEEAAREMGYPLVIRPSFTLGGEGGGIARGPAELRPKLAAALDASPSREALVEESVLGWKEYELEVMRDRKDNFVVVCSIENLDPMGVHTGDSITVAPAQTLSDREYQAMRDEARRAVSAVGVETGGCNVQFAVDPRTGRRLIIEINPRVSRSSALASKATGFPIAKIAARLALGAALDEIPNDITRSTAASFEPALDYVVVKVPRFSFEKFYPSGAGTLGTSMKSVGEAMALGRTFPEALQKALRSLETGRTGLGPAPRRGREALLRELAEPSPERIFLVKAAVDAGLSSRRIAAASGIDPWFIDRIADIAGCEARLRSSPLTGEILREAKALGHSDASIALLLGRGEGAVRSLRRRLGVRPGFGLVDTCAGEFEARTPYFFSTYGGAGEVRPSRARKKALILGSGPNRIGQGVEFDTCCVQACEALREEGFETVMVNCNPETVSTDYDCSDRLYFEPLALEDVLEIAGLERPSGVIVQFGGQTPLNLALPLERAGERILGTRPGDIDLAEDRRRFGALLRTLGIPAPAFGIARGAAQALRIARRVGYPVMVRPSYVLGGRDMRVVRGDAELREYAAWAGHPSLLVDRFLQDASEVDVDALCDGRDVFIGGIMEHIEEAGVHSGDSSCTLPPHSLTPNQVRVIADYTRRLALGLRVSGLLNVQYAVKDGVVFVLEANPRASRTVPFVSKATGVPLAKLAARVLAGRPLRRLLTARQLRQDEPEIHHAAVKEVVMPFGRFPGVDPTLGPEMRSTGEVMGIGADFPKAFIKSQAAAGTALPLSGAVFLSVRDEDKPEMLPVAVALRQMGYELFATRDTRRHLARHGVETGKVHKIGEGHPDPVDLLRRGAVSLVINTPSGERARSDGYLIRRTALDLKVPCVTNVNDTRALVHALALLRESRPSVKSLQEYHSGA
jgi:carbamoyl-phosphate synthase large subunit